MCSYLDNNNIQRSNYDIEYHPLKPFIDEDTEILFLGSFPPQRKKWAIDFFYPNFINDHWRIQGIVFHQDKDFFVDVKNKTFKIKEIVNHCKTHHIGFYDTATAVRRLKDNASDKFLEILIPTDINKLIQQSPNLKAIATTGTKATETICQQLNIKNIPPVGQAVILHSLKDILLFRLPSSSRAYPLSLEKKALAYKHFLTQEFNTR